MLLIGLFSDLIYAVQDLIPVNIVKHSAHEDVHRAGGRFCRCRGIRVRGFGNGSGHLGILFARISLIGNEAVPFDGGKRRHRTRTGNSKGQDDCQ